MKTNNSFMYKIIISNDHDYRGPSYFAKTEMERSTKKQSYNQVAP